MTNVTSFVSKMLNGICFVILFDEIKLKHHGIHRLL